MHHYICITIMIRPSTETRIRRRWGGGGRAGEGNERIGSKIQLATRRGDPVFTLGKRFRVRAVRISPSALRAGRVYDSDVRANVKGHALERDPLTRWQTQYSYRI